MAAIFKPQTEAEIRAALASKCNLILDPNLRQACLKIAATKPLTSAPSSPIPPWTIKFAAVLGVFALYKYVMRR